MSVGLRYVNAVLPLGFAPVGVAGVWLFFMHLGAGCVRQPHSGTVLYTPACSWEISNP